MPTQMESGAPRYFVTRVKKDPAVPERYRRAGWMAFDTLHKAHGQVWPTRREATEDARRLEVTP